MILLLVGHLIIMSLCGIVQNIVDAKHVSRNQVIMSLNAGL